tara:strand:- start:335 stop:481 length:147 start_codon:yes stop_codon:yes gene_type:complete
MGNKLLYFNIIKSRNLSSRNMATNEELEKRIENLEKKYNTKKLFCSIK